MADEIGQIQGTVVIDSDLKGLDEAEAGFKSLGKSSEILGHQTGVATQGAAAGFSGLKVASLAATAAVTGVGVALVGAGAGLAYTVGPAMDFEKGLSNIKAVSGATAAEIDLVKEKALQIGQDTSFSAQEAVGAIEELIKAGVDVQGVLGGAADAAVSLAAAGEVDMPTAAAIASAAMNNFGVSAKELPQIADLIAGAANASAISVEDFGYSLSASGAVASLAGFNFDDLAVAITAMGNAGIKGSDAGTSLKTMFSNLQPSTDEQIGLFRELGILTEDGANAFYDAEGSVKSMSEVAGILSTALEGMTDQQKQATLETMFGSDAIRAAAILAEEGSAGIDGLAASMGKISAADVAKDRLNNLAGSVDAFWGSLETLRIKAGLALTPVLKLLVDFGTQALNMLSPVLDQITPMIEDFFGGIDVEGMLSGLFGGGEGIDVGGLFGDLDLGEIGSQLMAIGSTWRDAFSDPAVSEFLVNLGTQLRDIGAFIVNPLLPISLKLSAAFAEQFAIALPVVLRVANVLHDVLWPVVQGIFDFVRQHQGTVADWLIMTQAPLAAVSRGFEGLQAALGSIGDISLPDVGGWLGGLFGGGEAEAAGAGTGTDWAAAFAKAAKESASGGLSDALSGALDVSAAGQGFADSLQPVSDAWATFTDLFSSSDEWSSGAFEGLLGSVEGAWNELTGKDPDEVGWIQELGTSIDGLSDVFTDAWASIQSGIDSAWAEFDSAIQGAQDAIYSYLLDIWLQIPEDIRADLILIASHILEQFGSYRQTIEDKLAETQAAIASWLSDAKAEWDAWLSGIVTAAAEAWADVKTSIMTPLTEARTELSAMWSQVESEARAAWSGVLMAVTDKVNGALAYLSGIRAEVEQRARDAWAGVVTAAQTALSPLVSAVTSRINDALAYLAGIRSTVEGQARETWDGFISATQSALARFKDALLAPIRAGIDSLKTAGTEARTQALAIGRGIIDGIVNAVVAGKDRLISAALAGVRGLLDAIKAFLGIASPSTVSYSVFWDFVRGGVLAIQDGASLWASAATDAVAQMVEAVRGVSFASLVAGDPDGDIAAAVASMGELYAAWQRQQTIADEVNAGDLLAAPIRRMNEALAQFFDGGAAGSLASLLAMMRAPGLAGFVPDEGDMLERLGFSERSFEEIQRSIEALAGEPEKQSKLWGDFIEGLMSQWEAFYESQKAPLEEQKRAVELLKKAAQRDPTRTGTEFDPRLEAIQAEIDLWEARNDAIQRGLDGQEATLDGILAAYKRISDAVESTNEQAEQAHRAYLAALKVAQDTVKARQDSAEEAEDSAHDHAMDLLEAEERRREKAYKAELRRLEAHRAWVEADVAARISAEEQAHQARMAAITAEVDAADRINEAEEARLDRANLLLDTLEAGNALTAEQVAFLRAQGIDPDQIARTNQGLGQARTNIDRAKSSLDALAQSLKVLTGFLDKVPDELGRVRIAGGELRSEAGRRLGPDGGPALISQAERDALQKGLDEGTLTGSDKRIAKIALAGGVVQATRLREVLATLIAPQQAATEAAQQQLAAAESLLDVQGQQVDAAREKLKADEAALKVAKDEAKTKREGLSEQLRLERESFEAFKTAQEGRVSALDIQEQAVKDRYSAERDAIAEAKDLEQGRHAARMRQIQEEYALQLLSLGKTDAEIQAILDAQRARAAAIATEAEERFNRILAEAERIRSGQPAEPPPTSPFVPPAQPPPGIEPPVNPSESLAGAFDGLTGSAEDGAEGALMTFEEMFGTLAVGATAAGAAMAHGLVDPVFAALGSLDPEIARMQNLLLNFTRATTAATEIPVIGGQLADKIRAGGRGGSVVNNDSHDINVAGDLLVLEGSKAEEALLDAVGVR